MTDLEIFAFRYDADLGKRVAVEVAKCAKYIIEGGGNQNALAAASNALLNPEAAREAFIWDVALDTAIQADPANETAIRYVVDANYERLWIPG